jgi:hypothetical protein
LFTTGSGAGHTLAITYGADSTRTMSVGPERTDVAAPPSFTDEPTRQLSVAGTSDHRVNCGAPLASDQRYCVNCGERRGKPRFALAGPHEEAVQETTVHTAKSPRRPRTSSTFNLIAGVATLLLAMLVGVLIGHSNSSNASKSGSATPSITVNGGGASTGASSGASTGASTGSGSGASASTSSKAKHGKAAKAAKAAPTKVVIQKAQAAASKVTGGSAKVAGATDTTGSACTAGTAGCQNGKLTGNYFGQ